MTNRSSDLLNGLEPDDAVRILSLGSRKSLPSGADLFQLGDRADSLYLVERGRITLTLPLQLQGREQDIVVDERNPGQVVGWSALIPPYRFTLKATAPVETELTALTREALREHFAAHPAVGCTVTLNLAAVVGQRLQLFRAMWLREIQRTVERTVNRV